MRRGVSLSITILALGVMAGPADAQYWGGWTGPVTAAGSNAMGAGMLAEGVGAGREQTAEARSINAQTAMQVNEYMWQNQQRRNRDEAQLLAKRQALVNETAETNYNRKLNNPDAHDIHTGDASNIIYDQLTDPKVYAQVLQKATQPIPSQLVKDVPLSFAAQALTVCLDEYQVGGAPDVLQTSQAFAQERGQLRALAAQARKEADSQGAPNPETLAKAREIVKAALAKVPSAIPAGPDQRAATNYLKGLYGLTKMVQKPDIGTYLRDLDKVETTSLGHLISFMHTFGLRFGAADSPPGEAAHDQLYPLLVALRDSALQPGQASTPFQVANTPPDHSKLTAFFAGMPMPELEGQGTPPAPAPRN